MRLKWIAGFLALTFMISLAGCGAAADTAEVEVTPTPQPSDEEVVTEEEFYAVYVDVVELLAEGLEYEAAMVAEAVEAAVPDFLQPVASGELVEENGKAIIDYSNTQDGYIMVRYIGKSNAKLKAQVIGPKTTYTYNLVKGEWSVLPLTDGNGKYQFKIFQNVSGSQYALVLGASTRVELVDEFAPFLRPNKYVDYGVSSNTVEKARELTKGIDAPLEKVGVVYDYVVKTLSYDKKKAATVKSGYIPNLDEVLKEKKGICFDYAALMTGMLRSQGIPCKMVFGYAGNAYHAWISVWTEETGWVDGAIFFNGTSWQRIDPTFASSANRSEAIMKYIGNGKNYKEKYLY